MTKSHANNEQLTAKKEGKISKLVKKFRLNRVAGVLSGVVGDIKELMIVAIMVGMAPHIVVLVTNAFNVSLGDAWAGALTGPGIWVTSSLLIGAVVSIGMISRIFPALSKLNSSGRR